jgi:hypothetical protein
VGIPQFLPCDFDTSLVTVVKAQSVSIEMEAIAPTAIITANKEPDENEGDEKNPN